MSTLYGQKGKIKKMLKQNMSYAEIAKEVKGNFSRVEVRNFVLAQGYLEERSPLITNLWNKELVL